MIFFSNMLSTQTLVRKQIMHIIRILRILKSKDPPLIYTLFKGLSIDQ